MCAINGFNFENETLIKKMIYATKHRGPDDEGYFCDDDVSLGNARLSIIDLSEKGRQPIWNEDKTICIVLNGEIYNFKKLREDLEERGHIFFSDTDTEVIMHLYEDYGKRCVDFLNGIFAFAIWDKNKKMLFLARDRVGVKPLYYYFDGKKFIFSSEIKAILEHPIDRAINAEAFALYLKLRYVPSPITLFKNVKKLQPAHLLIFQHDRIFLERYWGIEEGEEVKFAEEAMNGTRDILRDAVKRQLLSSDRPVGIFLSGGIDSTSVLGIASEFSQSQIKTYSVGFLADKASKEFEEKFNRDFYGARATSKWYRSDHHELLISGKDACAAFEKTVWHMDEPNANETHIPTFLLARAAKRDVSVVLGGDGGDELFGGYPRYYYSSLMDRYQHVPEFVRKHILSIFIEKAFGKKDLSEKLNMPKGVGRYLLFMSEHDEILRKVFGQNVFFSDIKNYFPENRFKDFGKYLMYLDLITWLAEESLMRSDKMTMAHGLEERVPILDHRLVEFAFRMPTKWKIRGRNRGKWIFRLAMKRYLPPNVLQGDKRGWFPPASMWLRGAMRDFSYEVLSPHYTDTRELLNFPAICAILARHISGREYNMPIIWSLLTFQVWHKLFMKR